jgi:hypothetical protein
LCKLAFHSRLCDANLNKKSAAIRVRHLKARDAHFR